MVPGYLDHYLKNVRNKMHICCKCDHFTIDENHGNHGWLRLKGDEIEDWMTQEEAILSLILAAYNGGITRLRANNYDINKMPRSTRKYVKKIMKKYKEEQ